MKLTNRNLESKRLSLKKLMAKAFSRFVLSLTFAIPYTLISRPCLHADFVVEAGATVTVTNNATIDSSGSVVVNGVLDASGGTAGQLRLTREWKKSDAGIFVVGTSTVELYNVMTSSLTGNTTFSVLKCIQAGKTIQFQGGSTQYISSVITLTGTSGSQIKLRPTPSGATWYISFPYGEQSVTYVDVANSSAMVNNIYAGSSIDSAGNNNRWIFDSVAPSAITSLSALTGISSGTLKLSWSTPGDDGLTDSLNPGSFRIFYSSVASDMNIIRGTAPAVGTLNRIDIPANNVAPYTERIRNLSDLVEDATYYIRIFAGDEVPNWSGMSNSATAQAQALVISILIDKGQYDFLQVAIGGTTQSTSAITITNNGTISETFQLRATTATDNTSWSVGSSTPSAPGDDLFLLRALFNDVKPSATNYFASEDVVNSNNNYSTAGSTYTIDGTYTGESVPINASRNLWWFLEMPLTTSTTWQQKINVTITATQP